jgi:4-hydroxy 2-oxovalerate aldolase
MTEYLDCTIRDGGYNNNWKFDDDFVINLYNTISKIGYDYLEIGFRNSLHCNNTGKYYNLSDNDIYAIWNKSEYKCKIAIMVTLNRFKLEDFSLKEDSKINLIRLLVHRESGSYDIQNVFETGWALMDKGYEVAINFGNANCLTASDIETIIDKYDQTTNKLKCIYLADTFGSFTPELVSKLKRMFKHVPIGFHGHNNTHHELINSIQAIQDKYAMIDSTMNGYGKNSGNTQTELLAYYKNKNFNYFSEIFSFFNLYKNIYSNYDVYKLLCFISGHEDTHTDYINFLIDRFGNDNYVTLFNQLMCIINYTKDSIHKNDSSSQRDLIPLLIKENIL